MKDTAEVWEVNDEIEGAVIERLESGDGGLHIVLRDGRYLVFPDAYIVAVCGGAPRVLQ